MELRNIEFHPLPDGGKMVQTSDGFFIYSKDSYLERKDFTESFIRFLDDHYSEAYDALREWFRSSRSNVTYFRFLIVDQFIACNSCGTDNRMDVDEMGSLHTEHIYCPIRSRCSRNNIVCYPRPNTPLSKKQIEVLELLDLGVSEEMIATKLHISKETVLKHKANIFKVLDIHDKASLIRYVRDNNLFKHSL